MIYSFYDVGEGARKGLGTYIILDHIVRAGRAGLPYVYLGYWVEGSDRMAYKASFRPMERLGRDGWRRMDAPEPDAPSIGDQRRRARRGGSWSTRINSERFARRSILTRGQAESAFREMKSLRARRRRPCSISPCARFAHFLAFGDTFLVTF